MYELKRVQSESRWLYGEFEKTNNELQSIIDSVNVKSIPQSPSMQQTISVLNLDSKVNITNKFNSESMINISSK